MVGSTSTTLVSGPNSDSDEIVRFMYKVFRIRDILIRIQMRIEILTIGSGCGSVSKSSVTSMMQKNNFFKLFNVLINEIF
jgi:hypothetical protein